ncbi:MAG: type II CAAX endopeptidase family protein [Oscillospiraceae bacterium]|nr:type II CAAX endopeptidase family protein [Oscillospiraceae bacterium]
MEKKTFTILGLALFAMAACVTAVQAAVSALVKALRPEWVAQPWFSLALVAVFYFIGAPVFYLVARRVPREAPGKVQPLSAGRMLGLFCVAMSLVYVGSWIGLGVTTVLTNIFGGTTLNPVADIITGNSLWLVVPVVCIASPFMEELVFRKLLLDRVRPFGDRVAILYTGLAFGLYHMNFAQFFYAAAVGFLFAYIALRTNSFLYSFALHALVNLVGSVVMPLLMAGALAGDLTDPAALLTPNTLIAVGLMVLFFAGCFVYLLAARRRFTLQPARWRFSVPIGPRVILLNPGALLYTAGCLVFFFLAVSI